MAGISIVKVSSAVKPQVKSKTMPGFHPGRSATWNQPWHHTSVLCSPCRLAESTMVIVVGRLANQKRTLTIKRHRRTAKGTGEANADREKGEEDTGRGGTMSAKGHTLLEGLQPGVRTRVTHGETTSRPRSPQRGAEARSSTRQLRLSWEQ